MDKEIDAAPSTLVANVAVGSAPAVILELELDAIMFKVITEIITIAKITRPVYLVSLASIGESSNTPPHRSRCSA